jgi:hypothetical protein
MRRWDCESLSASTINAPIRRTRSPCSARAASGHVAALPNSVMNSRRLRLSMGSPSGTETRCASLPHAKPAAEASGRRADERDEFATFQMERAPSRPRRNAMLPHSEAAAEGPASPWGRPESF